MNFLRLGFTQSSRYFQSNLSSFAKSINLRHFCDNPSRGMYEKSINNVTLLGRVGIKPQLRGTEHKPVVIFSLATNINYKYETGEYQQKTEWHRISVFKPQLRDLVLNYLQKGTRLYVEGRIAYGEFSDSQGVLHNTTSIIANEIVFLSPKKKDDMDSEEIEDSPA